MTLVDTVLCGDFRSNSDVASVVIEVSLAWCFVMKSEECQNRVALHLVDFTHQRFEVSCGCKFDCCEQKRGWHCFQETCA